MLLYNGRWKIGIIDINMCRICMKTIEGMSIYSDNEIIKKIQFCTRLEILQTDDLPKRICNKCVEQLEVAYDFRKQAEYTDKYLRRVITHHKEELNQSALGKPGLSYDEMVSEIDGTGIKVEQDDEIEQLTDFDSREIPMVNIPATLRVPVYAVVKDCAANKVQTEQIEEADLEKIQGTKQINLFTIAKVTSIPKTEFNQIDEVTGNHSMSAEDIDSLTDDIRIPVEQGGQMTQPTDVRSAKISETLEGSNQYKGSTCEQITTRTITKVTCFHKNEGDQTYKLECTVCGAHFKRKYSLKLHSLIHSGELPYKCNLCDRSFTQSNFLSRHMRRHTVEKPCTCGSCGSTFRYYTSLQRHFFIEHEHQKVIKL